MNKYLIPALFFLACTACAYERLQGPTEVTYWDRAQTYNGYTFFGAQGTTYLIDMEGRVAHTWPIGTNPRLLDNGDVLDATGGDVGALRFLNLHEYQSKDLMEAHGVLVRAAAYPVPAGRRFLPRSSGDA